MTDPNTNGDKKAEAAELANYLGPYEAWNFGIGKAYAFPAYRREDIRFLTALAEHPEPQNPHVLQESEAEGRGLWLPTMWGKAEGVALRFWPIVVENRSETGISLESVPLALKDALHNDGVDQARFRMAFPVEERAMHGPLENLTCEPEWTPDLEVPAAGNRHKTLNVLGIIDDGIPFAHRNFRAADGKRTRLEFCWLQSAQKEQESTRPGVLFGREYTRERIESLIMQYGGDEDALYAAAGASDEQFGSGAAINRLVTHGAHIMDIAAGCDPNKSAEPPEETRLVAVQLPNTYPWDTSSFGKDMYMLAAVHYILERAERIAKGYGIEDIRVTINCSYGFSAGRHDGASELEAAIDEIVTARRKLGRPTAFVIPSGNTFQDRLHGEISKTDLEGGSFTFKWAVQPNDRTPNYLEMWFPADLDPGIFSVEISAPLELAGAGMDLKPDVSEEAGDPRRIKPVTLGGAQTGDAIGLISLDNHRRSNRWRVLFALAPTEPDETDLPAAPAGEWRITLTRRDEAPDDHGPVYLWVQRDVDLETFRKGNRQSYLKDLAYRITDDRGDAAQTDASGSHVQRFGSISGIAGGSTCLVVSGCTTSARSLWDRTKPVASIYSSAGKISSEALVGSVDCTAQADRSKFVPGMVGAGTRSGSYATLQGTSVAAPLVARRLSEAFATCSDVEVRNAEPDNYLPILNRIELPNQSAQERARLGKFLIL